MAARADVVIAGAGFVGLALGTALARAGLSVLIADPTLARPAGNDPRASTLVAGAVRMLRELDAWSAIEPSAEPMLGMDITDSRLSDVMRPVLLSIIEAAAPGEPFAYVVPNGAIREGLMEAAWRAGVQFQASAIASIEVGEGYAQALLSNGEALVSSLLVGAEGASSPLRGMAGIAVRGWRYDQAAIVTNVSLEKPHEGIAVQHFVDGGPFALLPLPGRRASVVWSDRRIAALKFAALDDADFRDELQARAGYRFGRIELDGPRAVRPLKFAVARSFVATRVALAGDAAHAMHPIAGQGLNVGLRDVAALAESVVDAARLGLDIGSEEVLRRYETWRRFDVMVSSGTIDGLVRLFTARSGPARLVRDVGLGVVNRLPSAKSAFVRSAAGLAGDVPRLLKGEAL
ncbi:FAD-dependent monooxygenase [Terrihabitans sp. B22-R8]|uniref:FAD-dependent monooxygenase n=1 Tax=Terrihabitans sp. B22-R8 TaxID=3425128 RepID=UPI00403CE37B